MQGMNKVGNWAEDGYPESGRYGVWRENEISGASHTYLASIIHSVTRLSLYRDEGDFLMKNMT